MASTSTRTLRLLSLLQAKRYWPGGELADRLGVSPRTLRRDVDRLRELGYPVEGIADSSVRALAKVVQVMPGRLRRRVEALAAMTVPAAWDAGSQSSAGRAVLDPSVLTTIALACRDSERIRFAYTAAGGAQSSRHVEPHRLVSLGRRWYLVGYDLDRQDWRSFRMDRLSEPSGSGARFRPRELPAQDAAAFVRAGISSAWNTYEVDVVVDAPADQVRARIGRWATVDAAGPGRCRVRMSTDSLDWPLMALGTVGAEFSVVSPPELVDQVRDWGGRFSRAGRGTPQ